MWLDGGFFCWSAWPGGGVVISLENLFGDGVSYGYGVFVVLILDPSVSWLLGG